MSAIDDTVSDHKAFLEMEGFTVIRTESYRRLRERVRVAEQVLENEKEHSEHARAWAGRAFDEQRRLGDRLTFVWGIATAHGATAEELAGPLTDSTALVDGAGNVVSRVRA